MADQLNVLLLESEPGAALVARDELEAAGHMVRYCHEPGEAAFPCNALIEGKRCPLEGEAVDVALDIRRHPRAQPTLREDGVTCALREHVPVVVAGAPTLNPYGDFVAETLDRNFDVVETVERVAGAQLDRHSSAAAAALHDVLQRRGITRVPAVSVRRRRGALVISVAGAGLLDVPTKSMAAVRMTAAVRAIDAHARGVDVVFDPAPASC
jgi:hypothetical protein